jgi:hypothetical protein
MFAERSRGNLDKIWQDRIKDNLHKRKLMKTDENEIEFIEFDLVLFYYIEEYKMYRKYIQK